MNEAEKRGYKKVRITDRCICGWPVGTIAWLDESGDKDACWNEDCTKVWYHSIEKGHCEYVTDELKLEVGKYYRTRGGKKALVVRDDGSAPKECLYVDHGDSLQLWHFPDGRSNLDDRDDDLIAEWHDETAATGPIVTETVSRIVPGVYGHVRVSEADGLKATVAISLGQNWTVISKEPHEKWGDALMTADDLTQAIATLTAIRDHLIDAG